MTVTVDRSVEEFTAAPRKLFIDGQWTEAASGKTLGPRDGPRGPRGLHRSQGGNHPAVNTLEAGAWLSPAPASPLPSGPRRFPLDKKQYLSTPRRQGRRLEIY
jgi:hypothetical protein